VWEVVTLNKVHDLEALMLYGLALLACYQLVAFLDATSDICYDTTVVVHVPAVQDPCETSRNRNGDPRAGCGFFVTVRSCAAAFF